MKLITNIIILLIMAAVAGIGYYLGRYGARRYITGEIGGGGA